MRFTIAQNPTPSSPSSDLPLKISGDGLLYALVIPVVFFALNKGWEYLQGRQKQSDKREDSEIGSLEKIVQRSVENKDKLLTQLQDEYKILLSEVIGRNDETLKSIQASVATLAAVQATTSDNIKFYAELSAKNYAQMLSLLERLDSVTSRNVGEAFSTQARLYADLRQNQASMNEKLLALHYRFDQHFGFRNSGEVKYGENPTTQPSDRRDEDFEH